MSSSETQPTIDDVLTTLNTYIQKLDTQNANQARSAEKLEERIEQTHILIRQNEKRINTLDTRTVKLDTLIGQHEQRMTSLENTQRELRGAIEESEKGLRSVIDEGQRELRSVIDNRFRWMLGVMFGSWITVILTIFATLAK